MTAWCGTHEAPRLSAPTIAAMSRDELLDAVAMLEFGVANCGWRP